MATPSSGNTPAHNLAKGRQIAQDHQARYDSVKAKGIAPGQPTFSIDEVNRLIAQDATERDINDIERKIQAVEDSTTEEMRKLEEKAKTSTPSDFAKLREADEASSLQLVQHNSALKTALKEVVAILKEYPELRMARDQVPDLRAQITILEKEQENAVGKAGLEMEEQLNALRKLAKEYLESGNEVRKIVSEWQESVLQQGYGASPDTQLDIVRALQVVRSKQSQGISKEKIEEASRTVRAYLRDYPPGPPKVGLEMWLYMVAWPMQLDCSILLGLMNQGASNTDMAFLYLTIEMYASNPTLLNLDLETWHAILNGCHWLLNVPGAEKNVILEWLKRLEDKLPPNELVRFIFSWLQQYASDDSISTLSQSLLEHREVKGEQRLALHTKSAVIRHGRWILHVTPAGIRWLERNNFHVKLDSALICSQEFEVEHRRPGENRDFGFKMSMIPFHLSKLARLLPGIKV